MSMPAEVDAPEIATRELSYAEAIREALAQAMEADERVFLFGEDVGVYGGAFGVSGDLFHRFGPQRVIDTPISELGLAGAAVGAALTGMKPVLEIQFSDFRDPGDGTDRQPGGEDPFHVRWQGERADGRSAARWLGHGAAGPAQPESRSVVCARAGPQSRSAVDAA
jgi:hypothetical protein